MSETDAAGPPPAAGSLGRPWAADPAAVPLDDPRQRRTRAALTETLLRLLEDEPLDAISVARLCREAGVHRTTFYAHAPSVHAFALAVFTQDLDRLAAVEVEPAGETPAHVAERYLDSLTMVLDHVALERAGYRALFGSASRGVFRAALDERMRRRARRALEVWRAQDVPGAPASDAALAEAAAFIGGGLVGAIETWAMGDEADAAASAARIAALMPGWWPRPQAAPPPPGDR
ncbi:MULTISPECIES: TetR/AcrR family transcriptional regulator [unclassified Agromyces]|uniref:TetR/AcrR family transcriptional regulator n=1 Tax=unclassified Agromyces TaxID=2639701 RepID=UPI0030153703